MRPRVLILALSSTLLAQEPAGLGARAQRYLAGPLRQVIVAHRSLIAPVEVAMIDADFRLH